MKIQTKTKSKTNSKSPFKMFYVGNEWDTIFLLPAPAFKLWVFYYRLEGAKREGWATRETISEKCNMDKDAVTAWRKYLVQNGWMRKIGEHKTPNNPLASTPIMQVSRGTIPPTVNKRGKASGSRATQFKREQNLPVPVETESSRPRAVTERTGATATERTRATATESSRVNVDSKPDVDKTEVDGAKLPAGFVWRDGKKVWIGGAR
jgi:hypothetical protein